MKVTIVSGRYLGAAAPPLLTVDTYGPTGFFRPANLPRLAAKDPSVRSALPS